MDEAFCDFGIAHIGRCPRSQFCVETFLIIPQNGLDVCNRDVNPHVLKPLLSHGDRIDHEPPIRRIERLVVQILEGRLVDRIGGFLRCRAVLEALSSIRGGQIRSSTQHLVVAHRPQRASRNLLLQLCKHGLAFLPPGIRVDRREAALFRRQHDAEILEALRCRGVE